MVNWLATNILIRAVFFLSLILSITGCKLRIDSPEGGRIQSESGAFGCSSGQTCEIDIIDFFFDETFAAIPEEGHFFRKWEAGDQRLCGGRIAQLCRISTIGQENNLTVQQFLESDGVFLLKPIFNRGKCTPIVELEDHSPWVGPEYYYQYFYQQCTLPGVSEPVFHGEYRTYWKAGPQGAPLDPGHIRCAIDYDIGNLTASSVYDWDGVETVPIIRQRLQQNGLWRITHYNISAFMDAAPGELNDRIEIMEETRSTPYEFEDCFPWRLAES